MASERFLNDEFSAGEIMGELLLFHIITRNGDMAAIASIVELMGEDDYFRQKFESVMDPRRQEELNSSLDQWMESHPELKDEFIKLAEPSEFRLVYEKYKSKESRIPLEYDEFLSKIGESQSRQKIKRLYYITGIAASVLLAFSGFLFIKYSAGKRISPHTEVASKNDVLPGGAKAILTLGNGHEISLDSSSTGLITQQGATQILKTSQGKISYLASPSHSAEVVYNTLTTPRGGTYNLTLDDGTKVWLNAGSSIQYPISFTGMAQRLVKVTGEIYFEVASDKRSPFVVSAGSTKVEVLGTHFNIMAYPDENNLETTLQEGSIEVVYGHEQKIIKPDQQASISTNTSLNQTTGNIKVMNVDAADYSAWKDGLIELHHADIPSVMRQIGRWYDVEIVYEGNTLPTWKMAGTIPRTLSLSEVLRILELNKIHCKLVGRTLTVAL